MRRDVLLLQGPIGPFFSRFATDLEVRGFRVTKINFNGGDRFFWRRPNGLDYTGALVDWEAWLERLLINRGVGRIYLFGDCRSYHRVAREVARRQGVRVFVFEEGYIRPNFITLEEDGVNAHSSMMTRPIPLVRESGELPEELHQPRYVFGLTALYSMLYYWASAAAAGDFPRYLHHRPSGCLSEGTRWIVSGFRKLLYRRRERHVIDDLIAQFDGNYFVCPLQVHCDMQIVAHSDFNSIEHFIGEVLTSFHEHAPSNKAIVFKHHPLDRGYTDYTVLFDNLVAELGLRERVFYVHDLCLPTLLRHAQGTVLVNSTVGLSSLFHGTPVRTLGKAIYDRPELTAQVPLDEFWSSDETVDASNFRAFRDGLVLRNQLNGNFYRRVAGAAGSGIVWSAPLEREHSWSEARVERGAGTPRLIVIKGGAGNTVRPESGDDAKAA